MRYRDRVRKLSRSARLGSRDAFLVTDLFNCRYLTGFSGSAGAVVVAAGKAFLLTDFRYWEQARVEAPGAELVKCRRDRLTSAGRLLKRLGSGRLLFESTSLTHREFTLLEERTKGIALEPSLGLVEKLRERKDAQEAAAVEAAARIADRAMARAFELLRPGVRECDVSRAIVDCLRSFTMTRPSFEPIVASGPNSAIVHAQPTGRRIRTGEPVLIDLGAQHRGYCSDLTRTVFLGRMSARQKALYSLVKRAQSRALRAVRPGLAIGELDARARSTIERAGFGKRFGHGLGHGVGLAIHEHPAVGQGARGILKVGTVLTIEPGVYIPGQGGVRIEDMVLVRRGGCRVLSASPRAPLLKV